MRRKIIFIRSTVIANLVEGSANVGGIAVQLYFWAKAFVEAGWIVYTMSPKPIATKEGIRFIRYRNWGKLDIVHEWFHTFWVYLRYNPSLVMERGAGRSLYPVARLANLFHIKMILFGASDVNFEPGKELISGGEHNRRLFQKGILLVRYIVVQNRHQQKTLLENYGRQSLVLPNIWGVAPMIKIQADSIDVVWVANFRQLKRPEWIINAAKNLPQYRFMMIGGPDADKDYYNRIAQEASGIENLSFMGKQPFAATCNLVGRARLLACTSEFEGFPNTFLQAWSKGLPVITTVNPSGIVSDKHLGSVVSSENEFQESLAAMLTDEKLYNDCATAVNEFFVEQYSSKTQFDKLLHYINL